MLPDGRRHIAEFCFAGDCFGLDSGGGRGFSAEAIGEVVLMRYPLQATERLIDDTPRLARHLCDMTLRDLAHARGRMLLGNPLEPRFCDNAAGLIYSCVAFAAGTALAALP